MKSAATIIRTRRYIRQSRQQRSVVVNGRHAADWLWSMRTKQFEHLWLCYLAANVTQRRMRALRGSVCGWVVSVCVMRTVKIGETPSTLTLFPMLVHLFLLLLKCGSGIRKSIHLVHIRAGAQASVGHLCRALRTCKYRTLAYCRNPLLAHGWLSWANITWTESVGESRSQLWLCRSITCVISTVCVQHTHASDQHAVTVHILY